MALVANHSGGGDIAILYGEKLNISLQLNIFYKY